MKASSAAAEEFKFVLRVKVSEPTRASCCSAVSPGVVLREVSAAVPTAAAAAAAATETDAAATDTGASSSSSNAEEGGGAEKELLLLLERCSAGECGCGGVCTGAEVETSSFLLSREGEIGFRGFIEGEDEGEGRPEERKAMGFLFNS
ncbi:uncharacterized protein EMH_0064890 [Eimeria mitis]|uniref:Uncharacterized protein n=1 Tax=Eimeria mitis TaxID=44415 RepID=U6K6U8_9EIME|nr:uncharacterized protein EMH_0064890 [Eimeria mitis]CDJ31203.1 hypothetical protein EMH_0064890 [Eimeria mitis]